MSALPRLLEDPTTAEKLRADLRRAQVHVVAPYDTMAGLARLRTGLKSGGGPVTAPSGVLPGAPWKLMAALGVAGAIGWLLLSENSTSPDQKDIGRSTAAAPVVLAPEKRQDPSSGKPRKAEHEPAPVVVEAPIRSSENTRVRPGPASREPASSEPDLFAEEIAHLGSLRQLYRANPAAAISLAREGHVKFPRGMLYEEREALLILSLAQSGQSDEASRRATDFRARFPRSAFLSKMQQMVPAAEELPGATE